MIGDYSVSAPDGEECAQLGHISEEQARDELERISIAPGMMSGCYTLYVEVAPEGDLAVSAHVCQAEDGKIFVDSAW